MRSRRRKRSLSTLLLGITFSAAFAGRAEGQTAAQGFALERLYPAPSGGGWWVMDDLRLQGGLNGSMEIAVDDERNPLSLSSGGQRLTVVANEAVANLSAAVSYDRFRLYLDLPMPLWLAGNSGTLGGYAFTAPAINLGSNPDSVGDVRLGFDARLYGETGEPFRLGLGAQLLIPSDVPTDIQAGYLTDGTVRAMFRALFAGDIGLYRYAAQVGIHLRPLNEAPVLGSPQGSELLFGAAVGRAFPFGRWQVVVGPEVFGQTALVAPFGGTTTGVEGLLTGRFEGTGDGAQPRVKLGAGGGLDPQFGVPQWRVVLGVELFSNHAAASP